MGPWVPWHPAEAFTPAVAPRALLSLLSLSPSYFSPSHRDKWQSLSLDRCSGSSPLSLYSFLPRVLPESFPDTGIPASPWGTRCLLLWSNLSAPTLSLSGCVCVKYPTSCVFAGCQRAGGLGRAFFSGAVGRELCTPF